MRDPESSDRDLKRLRAVFAASALALLAATVWMLAADDRREWKAYQNEYPGRDAARSVKIEQIQLPGLTLDYHFCEVARTDRCTTCHQGMSVGASPSAEAAKWPRPWTSHPRADLYLSPGSPHSVERFGCTVCHGGQGSATEFRTAAHGPNDPAQEAAWRERHGWRHEADRTAAMRPRRFVESGCLGCHPDVTDLEPNERFPDAPAAKLLAGYQIVRQYGCYACHEIKGFDAEGRRIGPDMRLEPLVGGALAGKQPVAHGAMSNNMPGTMPKLGPSLREVGFRLDRAFLKKWIANPSDFRPTTRMPRLFGLDEHLDGPSRDRARRLEAVEIDSLARWLMGSSRPVAALPAPEGVSERPSVERGRRLLLSQGCLACHRHDDYPESVGAQGPDLSRLGEKYTSADAAAWVTDWLRDPSRHAASSRMPNPLLEVTALPGDPGRKSDPAADLGAYLLGLEGAKALTAGSSPKEALTPGPSPKGRGEKVVSGSSLKGRGEEVADIDALVLCHLSDDYSAEQANDILLHGFAPSDADAVGDERAELIGPPTREKKLRYIARRTIARRGCFGCHEVEGCESASPIGPALTGWGGKDESLLAFGRVDQLMAADGTARRAKTDADAAFYLDAIRNRRREGFVWQKLRSPRGYDYGEASEKKFTDYLRMGRFTLDDAQREAVATFLLGLDGRPVPTRYAAPEDDAGKAIAEGRKVLDRHACAECHVLATDRWRFDYQPAQFGSPPEMDEFDWLRPRLDAKQLEASRKTDAGGRARADVFGMPRLGADGRVAAFEGDEEDAQGEPLAMRAFTLWKPAALAGQVWPVGGPELLLYDRQITKPYAPWGGAAARLMFPTALADSRAAGANPSGDEAWGRLPPPLVDEGAKVRGEWLAEYLANPTTIRPGSLMRMPKYTLSDDEINTLVRFFEARSGRLSKGVVASSALLDKTAEASGKTSCAFGTPIGKLSGPPDVGALDMDRLDRAMRVMTDRKTFCAKCHVLGDYRPSQTAETLAPDLENVGRRLQADYAIRWLGDPRATLPYTPMPVNFPPSGEPIGQDLLPGSSDEQIRAMVELLMNYDDYLRKQRSMRKIVEEGAASADNQDRPKEPRP